MAKEPLIAFAARFLLEAQVFFLIDKEGVLVGARANNLSDEEKLLKGFFLLIMLAIRMMVMMLWSLCLSYPSCNGDKSYDEGKHEASGGGD